MDFIVSASESLLSDGRRLLTEGAWTEFRGNGEGHNVKRGSWLDDIDAVESTLGRRQLMLWLLSVRPKSAPVFLFSIISPPAMMTGAMRSAKKGSKDWLLLRLSCDDIVPGMRWPVPVLLLFRRTEPRRP